jgi:hypothetical protein
MTESPRQSLRVKLLVDQFMKKVDEVADDDDWAESDGWLGKMVLTDPAGDQTYVYEISEGKMAAADQDGRELTATMTMSVDTFLDLIDAALDGRGGEVFRQKYGRRHIQYAGKQWIVDSERFSKVFSRMAAAEKARR